MESDGNDSMNERAALECLATERAELKSLTYERLTALVDEPRSMWVTGMAENISLKFKSFGIPRSREIFA